MDNYCVSDLQELAQFVSVQVGCSENCAYEFISIVRRMKKTRKDVEKMMIFYRVNEYDFGVFIKANR